MSPCEEIQKHAAGLASLGPDDDDRKQADGHASECGACRKALDEGGQLMRGLEAARAQAAPSDKALERASAAVLGHFDGAGFPSLSARDAGWIAVAALLAWPLLAVVHRGTAETLGQVGSSSPVTQSVTQSVALALATFALLWTGRARPLLSLSLLLALALGASVSENLPHSGDMGGIGCGGLEQVAALLPLGVTAALFARRRTLFMGAPGTAVPLLFAVAATGGAVVGLAAMRLLCPNHSFAHVLSVHVGSVVLATLVGAAAGLVTQRVTERRYT